jgi:hypothetical protein
MSFKKYEERRERCKAIQYQQLCQVSDLVKYLNPRSYHVAADWKITVECAPDQGEVATVEINRGDFIVEGREMGGGYLGYQVVPRREFNDKFEMVQ